MNGLMPHTTTATELQRHYKKVVKRAKKTRQPLIVLSNNQPEGVFIDYDAFIQSQKEKKPKHIVDAGRTSGLDALFGSWTHKEAEDFDRIIEEEFEKIDREDWK